LGRALATLLSGVGGRRSFSQTPNFRTTGAFPPNFLFGVATASHQVEGGHTNNDCSVLEARGDVADSAMAVDHRNLATLAADLTRAQSLGINAYRFSIEWSRVEPKPGQWDAAELLYYQSVIAAVRARGMTPIVVPNHFTLPKSLLDPNNLWAAPLWAEPPSPPVGPITTVTASVAFANK